LRVTVKQAFYLVAAQAFAREVRLLPRAAGDDRRGSAGTEIRAGLT
jgi:pilus assembly protein CpaB